MPIIPFGKFRGCALRDVSDTSYLRWLLSLDEGSYAGEFAADYRDDILTIIHASDTAKAAAAPPITVTPHQQAAVDALYARIMAGEPVVRLDGGAGYGKSYTVKALLMALRREGLQAQACATSYVATQVLAKDLEPYGFEAKTVAKTLKQQKVIDRETGAETYELTQDSYLEAAKLLAEGHITAIDEGSMVNDQIATLLLEAAHRNGGHLLIIGDEKQLPPVKQETPSILCATPDPATLTEPMRYGRDSILFDLEQLARHTPREVPAAVRALPPNSQVVPVPNADRLIDTYVSNYRNDPTASHRLLLFRRLDVVGANNRIRAALYGPEASVVEDGERLMVLRTSDYPYVPDASYGDTTRFYSGESFVVEDVQQETFDVPGTGLTIPHWAVQLQGHAAPVRVIFASSETQADPSKLGGPEFEKALGHAFAIGRESKDWTPLKVLNDSFVSMAYQYATSVHRAQGQTTDYAYTVPAPLLAVGGIMGPALAYVALTRARKQCVVQV